MIEASEFQSQSGLVAWLEDFDFDAKCLVYSYTLYYTPKNQETVEIQGVGSDFSGQVLSMVKGAKSGDQFAFTNVKARCPGDNSDRRVNGLAFKIK